MYMEIKMKKYVPEQNEMGDSVGMQTAEIVQRAQNGRAPAIWKTS